MNEIITYRFDVYKVILEFYVDINIKLKII